MMPLAAALSSWLSTTTAACGSLAAAAFLKSVFSRVFTLRFRCRRLADWRIHFSAALMFGKALGPFDEGGNDRDRAISPPWTDGHGAEYSTAGAAGPGRSGVGDEAAVRPASGEEATPGMPIPPA
jgi:hypothetical protein